MLAMHHVVSLVLLTALSVTYATASRGLERLRRAVTQNHAPDFLGAWTFAAVILLPAPLIVLAMGVFYAADWRSRRAATKPRPWRHVYDWATCSLAAVAASVVLGRLPLLLGVPLALLTFTLINISLISLAIIASGQLSHLKMLSNPRSHMLELATQVTGVILGALMVWHQAFAVIAFPLLLTLQVSTTRRAVTDTGAYDPATNLWAEDAWMFRATELISLGQIVTLMAIDSHTASQAVLADVVRPCLDTDAMAGRYGDSQIVTISTTGALIVGSVTARRVAAALTRSGSGFAVGSRTSCGEDVSEMLTHALSDLMAARYRAGITSP